MVMPGDNVTVEVELIIPIAMEKTIRFAIREGGRRSAPVVSPKLSTNSRNRARDPARISRAGCRLR